MNTNLNREYIWMVIGMTLQDATEGKDYIVKELNTYDEELDAFLFSLGCYEGETITVVSRSKRGCVIAVKDSRYNIDNNLAEAIVL